MRAAEGEGHSIRFICHTRRLARTAATQRRVHGSDSEEAAAIEIPFFFPQACA
jgi:nucleoside diphosphate kinase